MAERIHFELDALISVLHFKYKNHFENLRGTEIQISWIPRSGHTKSFRKNVKPAFQTYFKNEFSSIMLFSSIKNIKNNLKF